MPHPSPARRQWLTLAAAGAWNPWKAMPWLAGMAAAAGWRPVLGHAGPPCDVYLLAAAAGSITELYVSRESPQIGVLHFKDGWGHREGGLPAIEIFHAVSAKPILRYYLRNGFFFREGGQPPALLFEADGTATEIAWLSGERYERHPKLAC